jgi:predicted DNA-binding protein (UPF0251 family)
MDNLLRNITVHVDTVQGSGLPGAALLEVFDHVELLSPLERLDHGLDLMVRLTLAPGARLNDLAPESAAEVRQVHARQGRVAIATVRFTGPVMRLFTVGEGCWLNTPTYLDARHGLHLTVAGTTDAVREYRRAFADLVPGNLAMRISRLMPHTGHITAPEISPRRLEVLRTAYDMGYYATPRACTQRDIAERLGVKQATVAEHLQRAESDVVQHLLSFDH